MAMDVRIAMTIDVPVENQLTPSHMALLLSWLSPAYPVGAYTYSHGIEWAVEQEDVTDIASLTQWIAGVLRYGGGWSDAVLFVHAWRAVVAADKVALTGVATLGKALSPTPERALETEAQGAAFAKITSDIWSETPLDAAVYPVVVGAACAGAQMPLVPAVAAFLHGFVSNLVSAGVRLVPLGQTDGQRAVRDILPIIDHISEAVSTASLEDVGGCAILSDLSSHFHETQYTRLFRS